MDLLVNWEAILTPGNLKTYESILGTLYDPSYLDDQGYYIGADRTKIKWSQEKYEQVFLQACIDIYGTIQGNAFYNFAIQRYSHVFIASFKEDDKYIGSVQGANIDLAYYFKYPEAMDTYFWTNKPEVRK